LTPERWQQLKALLDSALERKPDQRAAFLAEACGDDEALREELQSLLAHEAQAISFIEQPAFGVMAETLTDKPTITMLGRILGRYRIIASLGSGGMGEVYLAEDTQLGRKIALKTLPAHFTIDDERVRRFQLEARAASALNHPNIITIYEIGQIDSHPFIVTEFIEGETLRQHMAKRQMTISEALDVAMQLASALATAHQAGIVHRDIKPENIMVRADGIAKVLDFGLVKLTERPNVSSGARLFETAQGMVMGTANYMSPEQARGLPVDARTDIWSLGIVLFEMVGGRVPFEGATSSDVIASILEREPSTLARYSPEAPTELEWIVKKALRKDREERYQTCKELLSDLKSLKRRLEFEQDLERSTDSGRLSSGLARSPGSKDNRAQRQSHGAQSHQVIDSLAIVPLANSSADPGLDYFSDGITESIISSLSQLAELRVMAWSTVSRYKGRDVDPRELGRDLGVHAVLTGRLLQAGERLVIKTELVNATDGSHLWAESYSCAPSDILDIEAEISRAISEKLLVKLTTAERKQLTRRYPDNVKAYHAYLRGRHFWNKRSEEALKKGIEHFQHAIEEDPCYAAAYAGMSDCYTILVVRYGLASEEGIPKAKAAAMKALEIDDSLAEAHTSLAHSLLHNWEWQKAEREFKRAVELNPNDANAHNFYAEYLRAMGRVDQSINAQERAQELDPLSPNLNTGAALYFARRYDQAIDQCQKTLEMDRNFFLAHYTLAQAYEQKGMFAEAMTAIQKAVNLSPDNVEMLAALGRVLALAGRKEEARRILDRLTKGMEHHHSWYYDIALVYAALGEDDQAFECLEQGYEWRNGMMIHLNVEPRFDSLRADPRFQSLVRRMGLSPVETSQLPAFSEEKKV
jgi:serine/threonine protein kinase/Tfp pilus assembly protein PilF